MHMGMISDRIRTKLTAALDPDELQIDDESARHAGHAGHREGGETHFNVRIVAAGFKGMSRVARQRHVYALLKDELAERVHALALTTLTPDEAQGSR